MSRLPCAARWLRRLACGFAIALAGATAGCSAVDGGTLPSTVGAPAAGPDVEVRGTVAGIDTAPWAYDGNAVLLVASDSHGRVSVQLPARWNLCKAKGGDIVQTLAVGDRVLVRGRSTGAGEVTVCESADHLLRRLD